MERLSTLALSALLLTTAARAQTCDLVFFTDDGQKFTLIVDGEQKNDAPASRVVATGIRNETPMCMIRFEDKNIAEIRKGGWFPLGKEYTVMITTNKKGERVLRPSGEAELGTASKSESAKLKPTNFQDDGSTGTNSSQTTATQAVGVGGTQTTTTTRVTEDDMDGENVNMSIGVNGVGVNMNVAVTEGMVGGTTTTTTSHTTTTTTTSSHTINGEEVQTQDAQLTRPSEPTAYVMPGYSGKVGCPWPMNTGEFDDAKNSITSKSFEDSKMTLAKQIAGDRCLTVDQVKGLMGLFSFEDSKLDFAKFAYDHTYDISNYYKVNDAFTFESSIDELNEYVRSR